jgi:serine/threonine protein kinase
MIADHEALLHGRYRAGTALGSGGYSSVSRGWDTQENGREVAIKRINLRGLSLEETVEATNTYNREIEALSALAHPQVPRLYDHFADLDHWYLILEYIPGQTLEAFLSMREAQNKPLSLEEIIATGLQLCAVLEHLHTRQPPIIFRDLKPGNIMRTPGGKLYLIDFGIARRYTPGQSRDTQALGSPGYAAPEQYGRAQTDARTDIYGLGALLRQLLTGQDPSDKLPGLRPSRLNGQPGNTELEGLIARMLAPNPGERPRNVFQVSRELEQIRQLRLASQQSKSIWQPPAPQDYTPATAAAVIASAQVYLQHATIPQPGISVPPGLARPKRLTRRRVLIGLGASALVASVGIGIGIGTNMGQTAPGQTVYTYRGHTGTVNSVAWSFDSQRIASASTDQSVQLWDALTGDNQSTHTGNNSPFASVAFTFEDTCAAGSFDAKIQIWNASGKVIFYLQQNGPVNTVAWSPDGAYLACADTTIQVWDLYRQVSTSPNPALDAASTSYTGLAWSPDGQYLASSNGTSFNVESRSIRDMSLAATYSGGMEAIAALAWSPDGTRLAAGSLDSSIIIWNAASTMVDTMLSIPNGSIHALAWSPNNQFLASASDDGTVRIWSLQDNSVFFTYTGHSGPVYTVAWSPDSQYLASAGEDMTVQIWRAP